jgi:quercetin dioxygenase-like cupin family protein
MEDAGMIVKSEDAQQRVFKGVSFDLLAVGEKSMVTRMRFSPGQVVPVHQHPHEQTGYVLSGRYRLQLGDTAEVLGPGDTYCVPGGVGHGVEVLEPGQVIDFFTPPREDYL